MPASRLLRGAALTASVALVPAVALAAQPKSDGFYIPPNPSDAGYGALIVKKHEITKATGLIPLLKGGKICPPPVHPEIGYFTFSVKPKKSVKVKSNGKFAVSGKSSDTPVKVKIKGRFTSSTKATFKVSASSAGCKGSVTVHASYKRGA